MFYITTHRKSLEGDFEKNLNFKTMANFWQNVRFPDYSKNFTGTKLAFTFVVHHQVGLFEVLLKLLFRPYNAYCIYVGSNTDERISSAITELGKIVKFFF